MWRTSRVPAATPAPQPTPYLDQHFDSRGKILAPVGKADVMGMVEALTRTDRWVKWLVLSDTQGVFAQEGLSHKSVSAFWARIVSESGWPSLKRGICKGKWSRRLAAVPICKTSSRCSRLRR